MTGLINRLLSWIADSAAGKSYTSSLGSINLTAGNVVNSAYVDLPAGVFAINARFVFGSTSASASWCEIGIGPSGSTYTESTVRVYEPSSYWSHLSTSYTVKLTTPTRIYVKGGCSIARNGCTGYIHAVKLWGAG